MSEKICETCAHQLECEYQDAKNFCPKYDKKPEPQPTGGLMGWICPKCGAVMSPFQSCCVKCTSNWESTCGTGLEISHSSGEHTNTPYTTHCNGGNE